MEPDHLYPRNAFSGPVASGKDMERIFHLLKRIHIWECACCQELFPPADDRQDASVKNIFGVCPDCFCDNEDIDSIIKLPCDHDIYVRYSTWLRDGNLFNYFGPHGNLQKLSKPPIQFDLLHVLICLVGEDRMKSIIAAHAPHLDAPYSGGQARAFFNPEVVRWHDEYGFVPISHPSDSYPDKQDRKAWEAMRNLAYTFDHLEPKTEDQPPEIQTP